MDSLLHLVQLFCGDKIIIIIINLQYVIQVVMRHRTTQQNALFILNHCMEAMVGFTTALLTSDMSEASSFHLLMLLQWPFMCKVCHIWCFPVLKNLSILIFICISSVFVLMHTVPAPRVTIEHNGTLQHGELYSLTCIVVVVEGVGISEVFSPFLPASLLIRWLDPSNETAAFSNTFLTIYTQVYVLALTFDPLQYNYSGVYTCEAYLAISRGFIVRPSPVYETATLEGVSLLDSSPGSPTPT